MNDKTKEMERRRRAAGDLYHPLKTGDENWARAQVLCGEYNDWKTEPSRRKEILKQLLGGMGQGCSVVPPFRADLGKHVFLGNRVFINMNAVILDEGIITIGDDVLIGPCVQIMSAIHPLNAELRNTGIERALPITIEKNCWLGSGVIVTPGVTIHEGSVIGAGSVVTKDIPAGVVAVGNPCRVIGPVSERANPEDFKEYEDYLREVRETDPDTDLEKEAELTWM